MHLHLFVCLEKMVGLRGEEVGFKQNLILRCQKGLFTKRVDWERIGLGIGPSQRHVKSRSWVDLSDSGGTGMPLPLAQNTLLDLLRFTPATELE